jgi:hypothetical protein
MPPKKNSCNDRNKVLFNKLAAQFAKHKNPEKINNLLARALARDDELALFASHATANECIFSYPDSDWFSIYLVGPDGKAYYTENGQRVERVYFKLDYNPDGTDAAIGERTIVAPAEVAGKENCVITAGGNCGNPASYARAKKEPSPSASAKPKAAAKKTTTGEGPSASQPLPEPAGGRKESSETRAETLARVQAVQVGAGSGDQPQAKIERTYFENLGSKELIIDWMIKNMKHADIIQCIKRSSLSADQVRQVEAMVATAPPPPPAAGAPPKGMSEAELQLVQEALSGMSVGQAKKALSQVTKEELVDFLNSITDPKKKANKIVALCKYAGINKYSVSEVTGRGGKKIYKVMEGEFEITPDEIDEIINECSAKEAARVTRLIKAKSMVRDIRGQRQAIASAGAANEARLMDIDVNASRAQRQAEIQQIIDTIRSNPNKNEKKIQLVDLCVKNGLNQFNTKVIKRTGKPDLVKLFEDDTELEDDEIDDVLTQCEKMALSNVTAFGKRRATKVRSNFKAAAKKCKGKSNYRGCMKTTLRKMYRSSGFGKKKRYDTTGRIDRSPPGTQTYTLSGRVRRKYTAASGRKSPPASATVFHPGTRHRGNDGNMWVVRLTSTGVKRWVKV